MEPGRSPDFYERRDGAAVGCSARSGVRDLGRGLFVARRHRFTPGCFALFGRLDDYARRVRADAATTLADDGSSGGGRRSSAIWRQHGKYADVMPTDDALTALGTSAFGF